MRSPLLASYEFQLIYTKNMKIVLKSNVQHKNNLVGVQKQAYKIS